MKTITQSLIEFVTETNYDTLPENVVLEVKRSLLDSIGCAFTGMSTEKGKLAHQLAKRLGGIEESTVIGYGTKVSSTNASMANGELIYSLDFDAMPHIPPFIFPPVLAAAEYNHSSGKEVILASAIGQEIARRINNSMNVLISKVSNKAAAASPDVFGNSNEHMLGASLGVGKILNLNEEQLENALGLAGYLCSLPSCRDWEDTIPKSMIKYSPAGWNCQASMTAALLAKIGYTGSTQMMDNKYGFHKFYGASKWEPELITEGLAQNWEFTDCQYKVYPCCRFLQSSLDCLVDLMEEHKFQPEEIDSIKAFSIPFLVHPDQHSVTTQIDAQYSFPYAASALVHGLKSGVEWQDLENIQNPNIQSFMKKITIEGDPKAGEHKKADSRSWYARVELSARGNTYVEETLYSKGTNMDGYRLTDQDLIDKYRHNASRILSKEKIEKSIELIMNLEKLDDISELFPLITI